jgi:enoyl-CoA hydratase/carnithine racemase
MNDAPIYLETDGPIAEIVFNRPEKRNALNQDVWRKVPELADAVARDPAVKVVILRGSTTEAFSAGADISEFEEVHATPESARTYEETFHAAYHAIRDLPKPTIAQVQGICFGGGCAMALNCDLRYADPSARFCIPPARLGIAYTLFETKRLVDLVGPSKASEMLMGARVIEADEALATGLITRLFPAGTLQSETRAFAQSLTELSQFTIRSVKTIVGEILNGAVTDNEVTQRLFKEQFEGPDYIEGRNAFLAKRRPKFTYS